MRILRNKKGVSIVALIMAILLLSSFAFLAIWFLSAHSSMAETFWQSQQALYLADAGIGVNARRLQENWSQWNNPANFPNMAFAGGTITTTVFDDNDGDGNMNSDANGKVIMRSTGTINAFSRTVQANISRSIGALDCAVYTTGGIVLQGAAAIHGDSVEGAEALPTLKEAQAITLAKANKDNGYAARSDGNYFRGDFPSKPDSLNGVIYVDTFEDGSPADVDLSAVDTNDGNPALLIVMGYLKITGNVTFNGLIYNGGASSVDTTFTGNNQINGAVLVSHDIGIKGTADIYYNVDNVKTALTAQLLTEQLTNYMTSWQEIY